MKPRRINRGQTTVSAILASPPHRSRRQKRPALCLCVRLQHDAMRPLRHGRGADQAVDHGTDHQVKVGAGETAQRQRRAINIANGIY